MPEDEDYEFPRISLTDEEHYYFFDGWDSEPEPTETTEGVYRHTLRPPKASSG